ncbi:MAG TPA: AMP-binding protein, partial [Longimicrobium sp.]|nr:AMP-binding protein [Longimicrobium sp.]
PLLRVVIARDRASDSWVLLLRRHHLTSDVTSMEVLQSEIQAHLLGQADRLPSPLPFRNFVAQARLGVDRAEHEGFFREMLSDVEEPTAPFGLVDAHGDGSGTSLARLRVDAELAGRLREGARTLRVGVATLCHVAWAQVLARVSGRSDVVFGTVVLGRMQGGVETRRVLGPFINTLPVRIRVGREGAAASVRRTHVLLAELLRHEHASLALAQGCSGVAAPVPLFASLLNYRYSDRRARAESAEARQAWDGIKSIYGSGGTNYPLAMSVDDRGGEFQLVAQVRASVEPERVCALMHTALAGLVDALEAAPETPLAYLDVLPEAERRQVVEEWNATDAAYPRDRCIHELFAAQAARTPDAVAVVYGDEALTYAELNARAGRLAHALVERGMPRGERIAIVLPRSIELVVAELGVLKAGCAYVPLDPGHPAERLAYMVADSGARLVLGRAGEQVPELLGIARLDVDAVPAGGGDECSLRVDGEAAAYVMYTSGSTGEPKGVVVPHRAVTRLVLNNGYAAFGAEDRVAFAANPAFDATTMEVWAPLLHGGRIVVIDRDTLLDPPAFARVLREQDVTALFITTAVFNHFAATIPDALAGLRFLLTGGEHSDPASFARVLGQGGPHPVIHCYGPTETTTFAITHEVRSVAEGARAIPLGRPIGNTRVYVLDAVGRPVPVG